MKLYSAAADVQLNFSPKAKEWYNSSDVLIQKNLQGLYFIKLAADPVQGPYTMQQLNDMCEEYQDQIDDWFNEDDEDLEDLLDGDLEDIFEAFYVDDDLANDIDRRTQA